MSAIAIQHKHVSVERYLADELTSPIKHEYVGGTVYAMAGARNIHNVIAGNLFLAFGNRLRGKKCRPFNSDTKVRVKLRDHVRFYYPDMQVTCLPNPPDDTWQDSPIVIVEVLSPSTRRVDEEEKREAYLSIPTLDAYLLVDSGNKEIVLYQRGEAGFQREILVGEDARVPLTCLGFEIPISEIYEDVQLPALEVVEGAEE